VLLLSFSVIFSQQAVVWKSSRQSCFDFDKTVNGVWFNNLSLTTQFFSPQTQVSHHVKRRFSELTVVQVTSFEVWKILVGNPSTGLNNVFGCKTVACFVFFYLCEAPIADALPLHPHISIYQIRLADDIAREAEDHRSKWCLIQQQGGRDKIWTYAAA